MAALVARSEHAQVASLQAVTLRFAVAVLAHGALPDRRDVAHGEVLRVLKVVHRVEHDASFRNPACSFQFSYLSVATL